MFDPVIEVLVLAAVALIVLSRLYMALGKGGNDRPVQRPNPAPTPRDSKPVDLSERRDAPAFDLLRVRRAEIDSAELDGRMARVMIRYEADLGDGETTRTAKEIWTFMRDVTSLDPNWILDDVETAN